MTRLSAHTTLTRVMTAGGQVLDLGDVEASLDLDESQSPYGQGTVTVKRPDDEALLAALDPRTTGGLRLLIEMRESTGDPVRAREVTADHDGSIAAVTAAYGPDLTPAKLTADYFTSWNDTDVRLGGAIRANLLVTSRETDHAAATVTLGALTDEALLQAYRLVSTVAVTSGSLSVRDTVNFALAKIGAALLPGVDAPVVEPEGIIWEPGVSAWDYARGVAEAAGLVIRCDHRRRWTLTDRDATEGAFVPSPLTEARDVTDLDGDQWGDGVVVRYQWVDAVTGDQKVRYETATRRANPVKVVQIERSTPYPGPGAAKYWLKRISARGRVVELEQVSDYTTRPGQQVTASLPATPALIGFVESVSWAVPDDRQIVRTRGTADAVPNAIDLWPDGLYIDDLTGVINDLTTGVL